MFLDDIRDFIATLDITVDENCYCGRMSEKEDKSIGIYPLKSGRQPNIPIGGLKNSSYGVKGISILVHWNRSVRDTERVAIELQSKLINTRNVTINGHNIIFVQTSNDEPIPVGTDDNGVYEYVIECLFYYERKKE